MERLTTADVARLAGIALAITAAWWVAALFFGWQHHAIVAARGPADDLRETLLATCAHMLAWAVLTPAVVADRRSIAMAPFASRLLTA